MALTKIKKLKKSVAFKYLNPNYYSCKLTWQLGYLCYSYDKIHMHI